MEVKRIGVLTSGGDAPGMNAAIRAVVRAGIYNGLEVYGIEQGYNGLISGRIYPLDNRSVGDIINRGGTFLYTARCAEFRSAEGRALAAKQARKHGLDGLVAIGGDGTFTGAKLLVEEQGILTVGIPGTIDNDLAYTEYTLGFDTALDTILDAVRKIRDTMTSHDRTSVIEVMGRNCGDLAIFAGLCGGAEVVIVPEIPWTLEDVCDKVSTARKCGKQGSIVILAEGAGKGPELAEQIESITGMEVRATVLGHIQRGGAPSARDVQLACQFGERAVSLLKSGVGNRVVGVRKNDIFDMDIFEALSMKPQVQQELYDLTKVLA